MLPETQIQEELSRAYVKAVAANIGCDVTKPETDYDSVDVLLRKRVEAGRIKKPMIEAQIKSTTTAIVRNGKFTFPLPVKNYNDLREFSVNPRILIVLLLPADRRKWVVQYPGALLVKQCAYWTSLCGFGETANTSTISVPLTTERIFDASNLEHMFRIASSGEELR